MDVIAIDTIEIRKMSTPDQFRITGSGGQMYVNGKELTNLMAMIRMVDTLGR